MDQGRSSDIRSWTCLEPRSAPCQPTRPNTRVNLRLTSLLRIILQPTYTTLKVSSGLHTASHGLKHYESDNTGLFLSATEKLGSIGVHVRQRLAMHGFAFNVTNEPLAWFDQVLACGLAEVRATSLAGAVGPSKVLTMESK